MSNKGNKKIIFNQNIAGSINGIDVKEFEAGQVIDEKDLSKDLLIAWKEREIIAEVKSEEDEVEDENEETETETEEKDENGEDEKDEDLTSNTGDKDVDDFLNGETDKLPEGTEEISEEEAKKLQENAENQQENQEETDETEENEENGEDENADEKLLIDEARKILASEDTSIDTDRLKEIGIALHIQNMSKTVNGETIIGKIKKFIEDYDANADAEADKD